jgi:hypothetical protein
MGGTTLRRVKCSSPIRCHRLDKAADDEGEQPPHPARRRGREWACRFGTGNNLALMDVGGLRGLAVEDGDEVRNLHVCQRQQH